MQPPTAEDVDDIEGEINELLHPAPSAEEALNDLHRQLAVLRDRAVGAASALRHNSEAYYYLCRVMAGGPTEGFPEAYLEVHVPLPPNLTQPPMRVELPLLTAEGKPHARNLELVIDQAGLNYLTAWQQLAEVVGEASQVCDHLRRQHEAVALSRDVAAST